MFRPSLGGELRLHGCTRRPQGSARLLLRYRNASVQEFRAASMAAETALGSIPFFLRMTISISLFCGIHFTFYY